MFSKYIYIYIYIIKIKVIFYEECARMYALLITKKCHFVIILIANKK